MIDKELKSSIIENAVSAALAALLTVASVYIWRLFSSLILASFVGSSGAEAVGFAQAIFSEMVMMLIPAAAIVYCIVAVAFRHHVLVAVGITAAGSLILGIVCFLMQTSVSVSGENIPSELMDYVKSCAAGFGVAFPVLLGGLCSAGFGRCIRSAALAESVLTVMFIVISIIFQLVFVAVMHLGVFGASLGNVLSATIVFVIAVFVSFLKRRQ